MYPGEVSRQLLVNFCQKQALTASKDGDVFYASSSSLRLNHAEREDMLREYSSCLGEIRAYRKITEWAKEQVEANGRVT